MGPTIQSYFLKNRKSDQILHLNPNISIGILSRVGDGLSTPLPLTINKFTSDDNPVAILQESVSATSSWIRKSEHLKDVLR